MGLTIDGIGASEAIDSSGERISIAGMDISTLTSGLAVANWEHKGKDTPNSGPLDIVGHVVYAKKIFSITDCANPREKNFFELNRELPFVYIVIELFDDEEHSGAKAAAALIRFYKNRGMPIVLRYSIEGSTLQRDPEDKNHILGSIANAVALTIRPCNRTCISDVLLDSQDAPPQTGALEELARAEDPNRKFISSFEVEIDPDVSIIDDSISNLEESLDMLKHVVELNKAISAGGYNAAPSTLSGGSALQAEDMGDHKMKNTVLASYRDWNKKGKFKDFLKHRLPDASENFVEYFSGLVDDMHLRKAIELEDRLYEALSNSLENLKKEEVKPNPALGTKTIFSPETGLLSTPKGDFGFTIHQVDTQALDKLAFLNYAIANWVNLFKQRAGNIESFILHTSILGKLCNPDGPPPEALHSYLANLEFDNQIPGLELSESNYLFAVLGKESAELLDNILIASFFNLSPNEHDKIEYIQSVLEDKFVRQEVFQYFYTHHPIVKDTLDKIGISDSTFCAYVPAICRYWVALNKFDGDPDFWKCIEDYLHDLRKNEGIIIAPQTAEVHHEWRQRYGSIPALLMYFGYLVPQLVRELPPGEELSKAEVPTEVDKPQLEIHSFHNKKVIPGELEFNNGTHAGSKFHVLGGDRTHWFVKPKNAQHGGSVQVQKIKRDDEGKHYKINRHFNELPSPISVDANKHLDVETTLDPEQKQLIHGLDLTEKASGPGTEHIRPGISSESFSKPIKNASNQLVYVKSDQMDKYAAHPGDDKQNPWMAVSDPKRNAAYYLLAKHVFGLGQHVPVTAAFRHPKTGTMMSAMAMPEGSEHYDDSKHAGAIKDLHSNGTSDKLALMDHIMGSALDRHGDNYIFDKNKNLYHIDNSLAFGHHADKFYDLKSPHYRKLHSEETALHPTAVQWLHSLDEKHLANKMSSLGLPENNIKSAVSRLSALKDLNMKNPKHSAEKLINKSFELQKDD